MPDDSVQIAIEAVDNASDKIDAVAAKLGTLDSATQKSADTQREAADASNTQRSALDGLGGAIVVANQAIGLFNTSLGAVKQVWDFSKEGAENQRIAESFSRTAKSIGANADNIVKKLDEAARGTVDDEELMQASTRALTLGVAKNGDDLVNVMKLARAAALQFGGDAGQAFETINYAIGNLAPRALKQFGIIVNLKDASEAYAKANGLVASSLTEEQQRQALLNAVLEQGTKNFGDLANAATTTGEKMKALETRAQNYLDIIKEVAASGVSTAFDITDAPKNAMEAFVGTAQKMKAEVIAGRMSVKDYNDGLKGMANTLSGVVGGALADAALKDFQLAASFEASTKGAYGLGGALDESSRAARKEADAVAQAAEMHQKLSEAQRMATSGAYGLTGSLDESERALMRTKEATKQAADALGRANVIMGDLKAGMSGQLQNEFQSFNNKQDDLAKKAAAVRIELEKLEASQGRAVVSTNKQTMSAAELNLAQLKLKDTQAQLAQATDPMKQAELVVKVEDLTGKIDGATGAVTRYIDNSKKISELRGQYDEINKEISANAAAHEEATKKILFGYAEQQLAADGLNETEAKALDALAVKWGLKSQEDVTAMQNIRTAAANLAKDGSIAEFTATVGANLDNVNADYAKTQGAIENVGKAQSAIDFLPPAQVKVDADIKPAEQSVKELAQSLLSWQPIEVKVKIVTAEEAKAVAGDTLAERRAQVAKTSDETASAVKAIGDASSRAIGAVGDTATKTTDKAKGVADATETRFSLLANNILTKFTSTSGSVVNAFAVMNSRAVADIDEVTNYVDKLPTYKELIYHIKVTGAENIPTSTRGAQYGADFIVPANPHGGSGDYFPVMAAPGERVVVQTKAQQATGQGAARGGDTINYIYNNRITDTLAATMLMEQQRRERLARSNARMGVRA